MTVKMSEPLRNQRKQSKTLSDIEGQCLLARGVSLRRWWPDTLHTNTCRAITSPALFCLASIGVISLARNSYRRSVARSGGRPCSANTLGREESSRQGGRRMIECVACTPRGTLSHAWPKWFEITDTAYTIHVRAKSFMIANWEVVQVTAYSTVNTGIGIVPLIFL